MAIARPTEAKASDIRAPHGTITMETGQLPPEDFLSYGDVEDLFVFGETSQDREVPLQRNARHPSHTRPPLTDLTRLYDLCTVPRPAQLIDLSMQADRYRARQAAFTGR